MREDEVMRRREFIRVSLAAAGLTLAPGVLDSAARLEPVDQPGRLAGRVTALEELTHDRALRFPTMPAVDQLPMLTRDYTAARRIASEVTGALQFPVYTSMGYLAAFVAANLADQHDYDKAHAWYGHAMVYGTYVDDNDVLGWIAGRAALMPWYEHLAWRTIHDAAYAASVSPRGQLGQTLGNALAASTFARAGKRGDALTALESSRRAVDRQADDVFTAYSLPTYRWHKFASDVCTSLSLTRRARYHQAEALAGYPRGAVTDQTFVALDFADCLTRDGYPREGAKQATRAVLGLRPERALPALLDRADEVATRIGSAGRSDADDLHYAIRHTRVVAGR